MTLSGRHRRQEKEEDKECQPCECVHFTPKILSVPINEMHNGPVEGQEEDGPRQQSETERKRDVQGQRSDEG